jgi:hypothetical protein|tara:strand:- start:372 stop:797 length:426 start_codon:yes stop_codon:yes gene_type:complete
MNKLEKWFEVMKSKNLDELDNLLSDDVIFYSPVVFTPQKGKELTKMYLMAAGGVFGGNQKKDPSSTSKDDKSKFKYIKEVVDENSALLEFELEMDGKYINGIDLITWNEEGKVKEIKVMVRPLQAVNLLHSKMQAMLESMK